MSFRPFSFRNFRGGKLYWSATIWKNGKRFATVFYKNPARYFVNPGEDGLSCSVKISPATRSVIIDEGNRHNCFRCRSHCDVPVLKIQRKFDSATYRNSEEGRKLFMAYVG